MWQLIKIVLSHIAKCTIVKLYTFFFYIIIIRGMLDISYIIHYTL